MVGQSVGQLVGRRSVCHNFLKRREVTLPYLLDNAGVATVEYDVLCINDPADGI